MTQAFDPADSRRFVRTLRVAVQTALAGAELARGRGEARAGGAFMALAAKGTDDWRFPAEGLRSADGLTLARLLSGDAGALRLELQAQGAAGLTAYANRAIRLRFPDGRALASAFDRDGRAEFALDRETFAPADLSAFEIELSDEIR